MSDFQKDIDWWEGSDGKWYPPIAKKPEINNPAVQPVASSLKKTRGVGRLRVYLIGIVTLVLLGGGIFAYRNSKPEFVTIGIPLSLVDTRRDSGQWDVLPDCDNAGQYTACACELGLGYGDLTQNMPLVVFGAEGNEVGRSELGQGRFFHDGKRALMNMGEYDRQKSRFCEWYVLMSIPDNEDYYVLKVGSRGEFKYDFDEITSLGGASLTIEDD